MRHPDKNLTTKECLRPGKPPKTFSLREATRLLEEKRFDELAQMRKKHMEDHYPRYSNAAMLRRIRELRDATDPSTASREQLRTLAYKIRHAENLMAAQTLFDLMQARVVDYDGEFVGDYLCGIIEDQYAVDRLRELGYLPRPEVDADALDGLIDLLGK